MEIPDQFDPAAGLREFQKAHEKESSYEHKLINRLLTRRKTGTRYKQEVIGASRKDDDLMTMDGLLTVSPNFPVYISAHNTRLKAKYFTPLSLFKYFTRSFLFKKYQEDQRVRLGEYANRIPFAMVYRGENVPIGLVLCNMEVAYTEGRSVFLVKHNRITYCLTGFDDFVDSIPDWMS
jgi:hypothetical protein